MAKTDTEKLTAAEQKVYDKARKQALATFTKDEAKADEIAQKAVNRYRKKQKEGGGGNPFGKAAPSKGDRVSWNNSGGRADGKIVKIVTNGKVTEGKGSQEHVATPDSPVAVVEVYKDGKPTGTKVRHNLSSLTVLKKAAERVPWEVRGTFTKFEGETKAFGWAYVAEEGGRPVGRDHSGELATIEEVEKAAYPYVLKHRRGGDMHKDAAVEEGTVSTLIESMVVTQEKIDAMFPELPEETRKSMKKGWWVGFEYHDRDVYSKVRSGEYADFSIGGSAMKRLAKGAYGIPQEEPTGGSFDRSAREEIAEAEGYDELSIVAKAYLNLQAAVSQTEAMEKGTGPNRHGASVKCPDIYEALRREGKSKTSAAKISNECWSSGECKCH